MTNYARVVSNVAIDVSTDPASHFHPGLAAQFVEVPASVGPGWVFVDKLWTEPKATTVAGAEAGNLKPSPMEFLLLLTLAEQAAIRAAAQSDTSVAILVTMVDDTRLTFVDLTHPTVIEAIKYLVSVKPSLLTSERAARVLSGLPPKVAA